MIAPPGWRPFLQRLAFAMVLAHMLTEWAEYSKCARCQAWSGSSVLFWMFITVVVDVGIIVLILAAHRMWELRCRPCCQEIRQRRVGVAQTLNAALCSDEAQHAQQQHTEDDAPQDVVIDGEIYSSVHVRVAVVTDHAGNVIDTASEASLDALPSRGTQSAEYTVDGFVEDIV